MAPCQTLGLVALLLVGSASTVACPQKEVLKGNTGKGGLPTNRIDQVQATGTVGEAIVVPPELLYAGSTPQEGRPMFFHSHAPTATVIEWLKTTLGAVDTDESDDWRTLRGKEWTVRVYDRDGQAVVQYMDNRYLPKT